MDSKRAKGRPKRQDGDAGRDKLVSAARTMLRNRSRIDLNGKELAVAAGVTPALVRYYFQDKSSLIEAVAQPVVDEYLRQLKSVVRDNRSVQDRLQSLILLLLRFSRESGYLLDTYIFYVKSNPAVSSGFLSTSTQELTRFICECEDVGFFRKSNAAVTQTIIWGACKTVAQTPELSGMLSREPLAQTEIEERQARMIIDLIVSGLRVQAPLDKTAQSATASEGAYKSKELGL